MTSLFRNPVIPGFHPDPSVCRVGDDYYLVTSSFEWFPGVPVFHSRDLVHWRQLGHVLDRPSQLGLDGVRPSGGIYAATIRHHRGVFYVVTTLVDGPGPGGHLVVTATDPAGPWSEPHWLEGDGFDPSLFFDDDGRAWLTATREKAGKAYDGDCEVWLREFDPQALETTGEEHVIWEGSARGAVWTEGPRLFRVDGRYVLLASEGGTEENHAVVAARSDHVTGPYLPDPRNPVLTHRHLGRHHPLTRTGHADLVRTPAGEWWMVLLAVRTGSLLGRETFLTRVDWEDGRPVVAPVETVAEAPALPAHPWPATPACDHFDGPRLAPRWNMLRTPRDRFWSLDGGGLRLRPRPETLGDRANPSLVACRITDPHFAVHTAIGAVPAGEAGLALMLKDTAHIRFAVTAEGLALVVRRGDADEVVARAETVPRLLGVEGHGTALRFRFAARPGDWQEAGTVDAGFLCPGADGDFTGTFAGLYAVGDGSTDDDRQAVFDWFEYLPLND